ncbi:hypothetical protein BCEN4_1320035 [Burkholderia cenocepacia]|nr:hypothetical protein BCEN4_1320035 [Burkholderia cenocepacia]
MAITSASQADDVGSIPIARSSLSPTLAAQSLQGSGGSRTSPLSDIRSRMCATNHFRPALIASP